jgi:hypothetical protein
MFQHAWYRLSQRRDYARLRFVGNDCRDRSSCYGRPRSLNPLGVQSARPDDLSLIIQAARRGVSALFSVPLALNCTELAA